MKPPDITSDADRLFTDLIGSSKADKYYKTKRNRAFQKICDFTHEYIRKFDPEPSVSQENDGVQPNTSLFTSKKDRKVNENNETFRGHEIMEKARRVIHTFSSRQDEIRRNSISKNLSKLINNDAWIPSCQSFQEGSSLMSLGSKPRTAPTCITKLSFSRTRKKDEDSTPSSAQISKKRLSKVLLTTKPMILGFRSDQKPAMSLPPSMMKTGALNGNVRFFTGKTAEFSRVKPTRSEHVDFGRVKVARKSPRKSSLVEDFLKNYEALRSAVKSELLSKFLLKKIKHFKMLKRVFIDHKELRKESFTRRFLYDILKSKTFFQNESSEEEGKEPSKEEVESMGRENFLAELKQLNNELENLMIQRHKQELSYVENSLINSYEEYKLKELSFELKKEGKKINYYKNTTFDEDIALIKNNLESSHNISKDLAALEHNFGECWQINSKDKKMMKSMDTLYKDLNRRFQCVKDKFENPYFVV